MRGLTGIPDVRLGFFAFFFVYFVYFVVKNLNHEIHEIHEKRKGYDCGRDLCVGHQKKGTVMTHCLNFAGTD